MDCKNEKEIYEETTAEWIDIFRANVLYELGKREMSMKDLSDMSDVPYSTLIAFFCGKSKDMMTSNVIRIARSLKSCVDTLIGANTLNRHQIKLLDNYSQLERSSQCLLMWFSEHLVCVTTNDKSSNEKNICILQLKLENGYMKPSRDTITIAINDIYNGKVFCGFIVPCDNYLPYFCKEQIVLVANDRKPNYNEVCMIRISDAIYFAKRKVEGNTVKYYSIRDGKFRVEESYIDELLGYVVDCIDFSQVCAIL